MALGIDKLLQSMTGLSSSEMQEYIANAINILKSLDGRLCSIERSLGLPTFDLEGNEIPAGLNSLAIRLENIERLLNNGTTDRKENGNGNGNENGNSGGIDNTTN